MVSEEVRFALASPQTSCNLALFRFFQEILPENEETPSLYFLVERIIASLKRLQTKDLISFSFCNPKVSEGIARIQTYDDLDDRKRWRLTSNAVLGIRSAGDIVTDRAVSYYSCCADYSVLVMAVLRYLGHSCRIVWCVFTKQGDGEEAVKTEATCFLEVLTERGICAVHPLPGQTEIIPGTLDAFLSKDPKIEYCLLHGEDYWDLRIDFLELSLILYEIREGRRNLAPAGIIACARLK